LADTVSGGMGLIFLKYIFDAFEDTKVVLGDFACNCDQGNRMEILTQVLQQKVKPHSCI